MSAQRHCLISRVQNAKWTKLLMIAANVIAAALVAWGYLLREYYPVSPQQLAEFGSTFIGRVTSHSRIAELRIAGPIGRTAMYAYFTGFLPALACGLVVGLCGIPIGRLPPRPRGVWTLSWAVLLSLLLLACGAWAFVFDTRWRDVSELLVGALGPFWSVFFPYGMGVVLSLQLHTFYLLIRAISGRV